jgi:hypothetical protein
MIKTAGNRGHTATGKNSGNSSSFVRGVVYPDLCQSTVYVQVSGTAEQFHRAKGIAKTGLERCEQMISLLSRIFPS